MGSGDAAIVEATRRTPVTFAIEVKEEIQSGFPWTIGGDYDNVFFSGVHRRFEKLDPNTFVTLTSVPTTGGKVVGFGGGRAAADLQRQRR